MEPGVGVEGFHDFAFAYDFGGEDPDSAEQNSRPHISWPDVCAFSMVALTSSPR